MNNIIITGGCGYIGSILVEELLKLGYNITVIDNMMYNNENILEKMII